MEDFIASVKDNPVLLAIGVVILAVIIYFVSKSIKGGASLGTASGGIVPGSNIDPNTGLPYQSIKVNNFTSYPIVQTLPGVPGPAGKDATSAANLAYIRSRFSSPSVQSYDTAHTQGIPIRDINGNVIGLAPYGQSINVSGNPISGSSNLPGTTAGASTWIPVSTGSTSGYVSSFDLTGVQQGTLDPSKHLTIATPTITPQPVTSPVVSTPAKAASKYVTAKAWPDSLGSLSGIAAANGKSLSAILLLNPQINNPNIIYAGQSIRVS